MEKCRFEDYFHCPLFSSTFEAIELKTQCHIVVKVNANLPRPRIIATSGMAPALSPPTNTIHTHIGAESAAKALIARASNAKEAAQWTPHFKNFKNHQ